MTREKEVTGHLSKPLLWRDEMHHSTTDSGGTHGGLHPCALDLRSGRWPGSLIKAQSMGHPMFHLTPPLHLEECLIWMQLQRVQVLEYDLIS